MGLIKEPGLAIRPMRDEPQDYELLSKWLSDERVLEFAYGRDNPFPVDRVRAKFGPRVRGEEWVVPCMLEYDDISIDYMQYYPVEKNHDSYWQVEAPR